MLHTIRFRPYTYNLYYTTTSIHTSIQNCSSLWYHKRNSSRVVVLNRTVFLFYKHSIYISVLCLQVSILHNCQYLRLNFLRPAWCLRMHRRSVVELNRALCYYMRHDYGMCTNYPSPVTLVISNCVIGSHFKINKTPTLDISRVCFTECIHSYHYPGYTV